MTARKVETGHASPARADAEPAPGVRAVLHEPGRALDPEARDFLEPRFGHDFSRVRVHDDEAAAASADALAARAYTVGDHVVFGRGQYRPGDDAGRAVLAHELTHVVQQAGAAVDPDGLTVGARGNTRERAAEASAADVLAGRTPSVAPAGVGGEIQRDEPVSVDLVVPTPQEAQRLKEQGVDLPKASAASTDPRAHSDFIDRRVDAVGFGIYLGGYHLYVADLELPVLLPHDFVDHQTTAIANVDNVIYPTREQALKAIPYGPRLPGQPSPMTYFRGVGGLVVPAFVSPGSAPRTYQAMIDAQQELGRQVSRELTVLALTIVGGMLIKGIVGAIARVAGRARPTPPVEPPPALNAPKPGSAPAPPTGKPGGDLFYKPKVQADPTLKAGSGATNKYGDVRYSSQGSPKDVGLARYHESVHSALSPKLKWFREFRANLRMSGYKKSQFLQYLEEALAETYAQLRVNGIKGLPDGIQFPIKNGYALANKTPLTVGGIAKEAALGVVTVATIAGTASYTVYVVITDTDDEPQPAQARSPDAGISRPDGGIP